jgi:ribonuclease BN (tRNA processing enzyme)
MNLTPLPAHQDNYLWLLHDGQRALVVDPGDAGPVRDFLTANGLQLEAILVTPHHADHTGGVDALRDEIDAQVWGPTRGRTPEPLQHTPSNLKFATAVEPGNAQLSHYRQQCGQRRSHGEPTLPSSIALEKSVDPFLRTAHPAVARAAHERDGADEADQVAVFAALRQWKNEFR